MLEQLLRLLGPKADGVLADFCLEDAKQLALDYCNLTELPQGLETTVVRMAADIYRMESYGQETAEAGPVTSISEGEQSVHFASDKAAAVAGSGAELLKNYQARLNPFRKLRW